MGAEAGDVKTDAAKSELRLLELDQRPEMLEQRPASASVHVHFFFMAVV